MADGQSTLLADFIGSKSKGPMKSSTRRCGDRQGHRRRAWSHMEARPRKCLYTGLEGRPAALRAEAAIPTKDGRGLKSFVEGCRQ